eukprot:118040_1
MSVISMNLFSFVYLRLCITAWSQSCNISELTIFAISNLDDFGARSTVGAQWLAIDEINSNSDLVQNYRLKLKTFNSHSHRQVALIHTLNITHRYHDPYRKDAYFPIILGAPWSSLSTATAPVLGVFNMGQISASATSIALSETSKYPYFYRTVPSDALQAEGIILLCSTFNWTTIAVVYVNDAWGLYLSLGIQRISKQYNIDVTGIAVSEHDDITYTYAAKQIKDLGIFITVIIIHDTTVRQLMHTFDTQGIIGYPYFYIGTDGWLATPTIRQYQITNFTKGWIGTVPWQSHSELHRNFLLKWNDLYHNGYADQLYLETPTEYAAYGYDAMYTLAYVIQHLEENLCSLETMDHEELIQMINRIITTQINFTGLSGRVLFDERGDRVHGFFSFSNIQPDGTMNYVGYFSHNTDGNISYKLNISKIIWPDAFVSRGIMPRTSVLTDEHMIGVPTSASICTFTICALSILYTLCCIGLSIYYRKNKIIKAASWRLNIIICCGAILGYMRTIMYSIDEGLLADHHHQQYILSIVCNIRIWVSMIAFTLLFMPLFAKTYRLSKIFDGILMEKTVEDPTLFMLIVVCVMIDIVLLIILTLVKPLQRIYLLGDLEPIDALREVQYIYGSCTFDEVYFSETFWYFYGLIALWKACQALWGIHVTLNVSRVRGPMSKQLKKFDETKTQLFSILFTFVVIAVAIPVWVFGILTQNLMVHYCVFVMSIFLIGNVVVSVNLLPRICAVMKGNEAQFDKSPSDELEDRIKKHLHQIGIKQKWYRIGQTFTPTSVPLSSCISTTNTSSKNRFNRFASVGGTTKVGEQFEPVPSLPSVANLSDEELDSSAENAAMLWTNDHDLDDADD